MKENIPPLKEWSFERLQKFYELCGTYEKCGEELGCNRKTFKKYYDLKKNEANNENIKYEPGVTPPVIVTASDYVKLVEKTKQKAFIKVPTKTQVSSDFLDPTKTKVAVLDIETTSLKSDFGITLCAVIHTFGTKEDYKVFSIDVTEPDLLSEEKKLLEAIHNELAKYQGVATYFGSRFDLPFLRTRALYHGLEPIPKIKSLDLYFTVKRATNPSTRRLERINDILRISNPDSSPDKTKLGLSEWNDVIFRRDNKMLNYIITHCIADVQILENAINKFKAFLPDKITRC